MEMYTAEHAIIRQALLDFAKKDDGVSLAEMQNASLWNDVDDFDDYVEETVAMLLRNREAELRFMDTQPWLRFNWTRVDYVNATHAAMES